MLLFLAAGQTERGTSAPRDTKPPPPGESIVRLSQTAAGDYDPYGGDGEHHDQAQLLVDGDPGTFWSSETYAGPLSAQKPGVGVYVDANPGVSATRIEIRSRTPGWTGAIYGARKSLPATLPSDGWVKLADVRDAGRRERVGPARQPAHALLPRLDHLAAGGVRARRAVRDRPLRAPQIAAARRLDTPASRSWPGR